MIGALEDAEDYKAFETTITADYDAQSAVERELVLRLASLLWRLRRASTIETGLFEIQADHLTELRRERRVVPHTRQIVYAMFEQPCAFDADTSLWPTTGEPKSTSVTSNPAVDFARCFLRLANLPNFALDRLARYEATLWRQAGQILFALDALNRRKPQNEAAVSVLAAETKCRPTSAMSVDVRARRSTQPARSTQRSTRRTDNWNSLGRPRNKAMNEPASKS